MTTVIAEVYDAFISASADSEKARAAAEAIEECNRDISEVRSNLALPKWMVGFNLAFTLGILWKVFA